MSTRKQKLDLIKNMSDKDKIKFYKNEFETQVKIVFEVSKERNKLKKRVKELEDLINQTKYE